MMQTKVDSQQKGDDSQQTAAAGQAPALANASVRTRPTSALPPHPGKRKTPSHKQEVSCKNC